MAIPSGQSDRVNLLAPGSSVSVDPPNDLTYGSEVSVIADDSAFMVMEGHETGWRFGPPPTSDSALENANADPDGEGSDDELVGEGQAEGYPCPFSA